MTRIFVGEKMRNEIYVVALVVLIMGLGAGYFAGQVKIYGEIMGDKIECSLTVNPITQERLK